MFSFALWDAESGRLFCARDRFGEKPFHYAFDPRRGVFAFASEIKTLMALGLAMPTFDERALFRYFAFGEQAGVPQTIWAGVERLLAGHALEVRADRQRVTMRTYRYWDVDPDDEHVADERSAQQEFRDLFRSSVALRLRSDVPVGTSLSGGLDSTSVLCQIKELGTLHGQKAFTARMEDPAMDESGIVKGLLSDVGIPGHVVTPTGSMFLEQSDRLFFHQEEPYPSTSMFASYLVHGLAKANAITVLLDGQGADEYLAGYAHYPALVLVNLAKRGRFRRWWLERRALRARVGTDPVPWRAAALLWMRSMSNGAGTLLIDQQRDTSHLSSAFRAAHAHELPRSIPIGKSALKTRMYADLMLGHLQELLRYTDRNSMAHSREVRLPFLDHRLVEFCLRLPETYLYRDGQSKWILRESLRGIVPSAILDRRDKVGFATPWARWWSEPAIGNVLRERLEDAQHVLDPWVENNRIKDGSPASLDVLALASMRRSFEQYRQNASAVMVADAR
jgi:asparagine synthase (glutamine-hydrolysing)